MTTATTTLAVLAAVLAALLLARWAVSGRRCGREGFAGGTKLGTYVLTWYSFQDNTPCNSVATASGRPLIPFVSVAVPFRLLKTKGGTLDYGDRLFVKFLEGRVMPNGKKHSGWVQIDDFCGDGGQDSYCFQTVSGTKYPNIDLYIGDYTKSGTNCGYTGPAGSGQEVTDVFTGTPAVFETDYGGAATGSGKCGDCAAAREQQKCQWHYTPTYESWWDSVCGTRAGDKPKAGSGYNAADFASHTLPTDAMLVKRPGIDRCVYWGRSYNTKAQAWECFPFGGQGVTDTTFNWHLGADWGRFQCAQNRGCSRRVQDAHRRAK